MRAAIYSRVSTDAQERDGTSLDTQERACTEYAKAKGWAVVESIRDSSSGFTLERPGIERVRRLLHGGVINVVVAYAVDRLSRNQNHIGVLFDEVQRVGARLEFVTESFEDTAIGRFILAARAFIAEVEREKIAERTMRGKAERARNGRIPQGTGKGCYGYVYDTETGRRSIDTVQASVVRSIFEGYARTRSFSAVSNELNKAHVSSFTSGRWYPLTVRRVLINESYTGRLVYRRTKRVKRYSERIGKTSSRVIERPCEEWIEVRDACPRIVDETLWKRVQAILADPERTRRLPTSNFYLLRSRAKCGVCGSAMVGQTLTVDGRLYRYYRCRHVYDRNVSGSCTARYVSAANLERGVWSEVKQVLAHPEVVLQELNVQAGRENDGQELHRLEMELAVINERERRIVRLYSCGEVQEQAIREEATQIARARAVLQERVASLQKPALLANKRVDAEQLKTTCNAVAAWLDQAGETEKTMALEALQVEVRATRNSATVTGLLPLEQPVVLSGKNSHAHVRAVVGTQV